MFIDVYCWVGRIKQIKHNTQVNLAFFWRTSPISWFSFSWSYSASSCLICDETVRWVVKGECHRTFHKICGPGDLVPPGIIAVGRSTGPNLPSHIKTYRIPHWHKSVAIVYPPGMDTFVVTCYCSTQVSGHTSTTNVYQCIVDTYYDEWNNDMCNTWASPGLPGDLGCPMHPWTAKRLHGLFLFFLGQPSLMAD